MSTLFKQEITVLYALSVIIKNGDSNPLGNETTTYYTNSLADLIKTQNLTEKDIQNAVKQAVKQLEPLTDAQRDRIDITLKLLFPKETSQFRPT